MIPAQRKLFFPYLMANFPSASQFADIFTLTSHYADTIEIGIPFSDPVADGPVIQRAAAQVLSHPFDPDSVFRILHRRTSPAAIALMSYACPILAYGRSAFLQTCKECDVSFLIVPDVPWEESSEWKEEAHAAGIHWISFISLMTRTERLKRIASSSEGFLYLLSLTGITGAEIQAVNAVRAKALEIRGHSATPLALGFGIKSPRDVLPFLDCVDAFILGSKIIELIRSTSVRGVENFYREFCEVLHGTRS